MAKHRNFEDQDVFYASWTDAIQEYISTLSSNIRLDCPSSTTVRVSAGSDSSQAAIGIGGKWRYRTSNSQITISGSAATYDIHVVAVTDNNFTGPGNDPDATDYNFELRQVASGGSPTSVAAFRKVGEIDWDGTKITGLRQTVGVEDATQPIAPTAPTVNSPAFRARGISGQVEDIGVIYNNSGTKLFGIGPSGQLTLVNGAVQAAHLSNNSVTTDKIENSAVTAAKIGSNAVTESKVVAGLYAPTGAILPFAGSTAPDGWLLCQGQSLMIAQYGALHAVIGTTYGGSLSGGISFNLPDLRGRMPVGLGTHADVNALGKSDEASTSARRPRHAHSGATTTTGAHGHTMNGASGAANIPRSIGNVTAQRNNTTSFNRDPALTDVFLENFAVIEGGGHNHNVSVGQAGMTDSPAFLVVNYIIRT